MERSLTFYRDTVGLPLIFETPEWTEFSTGGATLALHNVAETPPVDTRSESPAPGHCRPGLAVEDLDAFHLRMVEHGVTCVQAPKDIFGARIAQYLDPDGLVISVSENSSVA